MCKLAISFWLTLVVAVIAVPHTQAQATPAESDLHNLIKSSSGTNILPHILLWSEP